MNSVLTGFGRNNSSSIRARVLYADTDRMGVVYHAGYFRWFEAARGAYMRRRGKSYSSFETDGLQLPLVECGMRYHRSALYEQIIDIEAWVCEIKGIQVRFNYEIKHGENLLVTGFTRHASINEKGKPTKLPQEVVSVLNRPESRSCDSEEAIWY